MKVTHPKNVKKELCTIIRTDDHKPLGMIVKISWAVNHKVITPDSGWQSESDEYLLIDADTGYTTKHTTYLIARSIAVLRYTTD